MTNCFLHSKTLMLYTITCKRIQKICRLAYENEDKKVFKCIFYFHCNTDSWFSFCLFTGHWNYTHTIRRPRVRGQVIEVKTQLSHRDYVNLLSQKDESHYPIYKKRRCFIHFNQYFQLDIYCKPCHPRYMCCHLQNHIYFLPLIALHTCCLFIINCLF